MQRSKPPPKTISTDSLCDLIGVCPDTFTPSSVSSNSRYLQQTPTPSSASSRPGSAKASITQKVDELLRILKRRCGVATKLECTRSTNRFEAALLNVYGSITSDKQMAHDWSSVSVVPRNVEEYYMVPRDGVPTCSNTFQDCESVRLCVLNGIEHMRGYPSFSMPVDTLHGETRCVMCIRRDTELCIARSAFDGVDYSWNNSYRNAAGHELDHAAADCHELTTDGVDVYFFEHDLEKYDVSIHGSISHNKYK